MFAVIALLLLLGLFWFSEIQRVRTYTFESKCHKDKKDKDLDFLRQQRENIDRQVTGIEERMMDIFFIYEMCSKLAPIQDKQELISAFKENIAHFGEVEFRTQAEAESSGKQCFKVDIGSENLFFETISRRMIENIPYFSKLLKLCFERIELYHKLQELSTHDSLTEIYNRRHIMDKYADEFARSQKFSLDMSLLMIDIDYFKKINDTYGHLCGDMVLYNVAGLIKENIREIDFAARYGGEEFLVVLPETDKGSAIMVAERIRSKISAQYMQVFDERISVAVSIGVGAFPQNTLHSDVLLETADRALYKAKESGRNRVAWF
ncbi:MAG: GGDEF domain-containing protein [Candidatus Omnitrophica bacterium]|nr:GGDEF domain-containing protein [Candidatus Omnitrophota bacterium]MDD5081342.1 GGDEF domain-containing protein [Candidatus Omnitrophota bacterium]